jgi:succinate dehydrogenase / fumarate reductase, membrane anchor subunit
MTDIAAPRSSSSARRLKGGGRNRSGQTNFELYSWLFMRLSGLALIVLVLGHLFIMNILDGGVHRINFGFVAGRWASPFWQFWDLAMLWLAEIHGANGLRTIIDDYARKGSTRFWLKILLFVSMAIILFTGTLVIFTFDPNIAG